MIAKEVNPVKKLFLLAVTLVTVLSLCLPAGAEPAAEVTKYGNIGRLSKLNITEDQLNDVLKDIMVNSICNRYVFYDTMTDMLMALQRGDIVVLETDQNTVRYIASRNENIVDRPPYLNPNNLLFSMTLWIARRTLTRTICSSVCCCGKRTPNCATGFPPA